MSAFTVLTRRLLVIIILAGCGVESARVDRPLDRQGALREWNRNEAILAEAIVKGKSSEDQLLKAVIFFHELTGISVRGDGTTFGFIPSEQAKEDLVQIREWCKQHCDELYWDEAERKVRRLPEKGQG